MSISQFQSTLRQIVPSFLKEKKLNPLTIVVVVLAWALVVAYMKNASLEESRNDFV